jgi:D-cysteine desulfhydrase
MHLIKVVLFAVVIMFNKNSADLPLFKQYPRLREALSYISLGDLPTPIEKLSYMGSLLGTDSLYIKRDDLTGRMQINGKRLYGGNKIRKLEFLIADALYKKQSAVLTFGGVGSNHALATTIYAQQVGLKSAVLLDDEPNSHDVRKKLLAQLAHHADMHFCTSDEQVTDITVLKKFFPQASDLSSVYSLIPVGGSNPLGTIGFVNAAFELKEQIDQGYIPEPDYIYVAFGSRGTTAGLILGLRAAGLKTLVVPVMVTSGQRYHEASTIDLIRETNKLLHNADQSFPLFEFSEQDVMLNRNFLGIEYGLFTDEGINAIKLMQEFENITLDGVYTGKAFAALIYDLQQTNKLKDKKVLFWNTYCGDTYSEKNIGIDYTDLPEEFHTYFTTPVQPLDALT